MKIIFLSDTHGLHQQVDVPEGDVLVHAGDWMNSGLDWQEVSTFRNWWNDFPHPNKILVHGNHDCLAEQFPAVVQDALKDTRILLDSEVEINGLKFWGSPYTPDFFPNRWSFNRPRGDEIKKHWDLIPDDTDILITHGPPFGIMDALEATGEHVGCQDLADAVERVRPKIHVFGHIHCGYGEQRIGNVRYINASQVNEKYRVVNKPIVVDI